MATGETGHVSAIAIESEEVKNRVPVAVPSVGLRVQVQQGNGTTSKTMTVAGTDVGADDATKQPDNNNTPLNDNPTDGSPVNTLPPVVAIATSRRNDHLYPDLDIPILRSNGNQNLDSGNEKIKVICNGEVDSLAEQAMGNSIETGCALGNSDDIKMPNGFIVGNGGMEDQGSKGCQAVRPKTISWSRLVKQRKDKKERNKKQNNVRSQSRGEAYLYPEMYSSSEEDLDDIVIMPAEVSKKSSKSQIAKSSSNGGTDWNFHLVHEPTQELKRPMFSDSDARYNADTTTKTESVVNGTGCESTDSNGSKSSSTRSGLCPPFDPVMMVRSDCILAPLAVPEDSGGSSLSSGSDSNFNPNDFHCDNFDSSLYDNDMFRYSQSQTSQGQLAPQILGMNNISCEENMPKPESEMQRSPIMPFLPNAQIQQLPRPASNDSLDEIGDYIDTDFPSQASRLLFACSSTSSSSTSSDEDEGYGVNAEPRIPDFSEREEDRNEMPVLPQEPLPFHEGKANGHREDESESRVLFLDDSPSDLKLCDRLSNHVCSKDNEHDNTTRPTKPLSRLGSCTGKSESGSEVGGQMGSDSSVVYSPEADFLEFVDSDLPGSAGLNQSFSFVRDAEILTPFLSDERCYPNNCDGVHQASLANSCEDMLEEGAASLTNNLNYDRCCTGFDDFDNNMERYDPHLHADNENFHTYCNPDLCKQEKVPGANFQNSASNRREKIFYKAALDRENRLSPGSSDEEENVSQSFMRDVASNLEGEEDCAPQNSNTECMYMGDLENLTHALQNAVIMQLPPKLEESSGESSDEPIYEEIECLEPLLTGDNSLHVVKEEVVKSADNVAQVIPKYEQRRRRGNKAHCHVEKVLIWNEYEAYVLQVKQIGTSACGPTAVLNVMKAFDYQVDKDEICKQILANLRMEGAPIPYYLFSRSAAGTTAENLLEGVEKLTKGAIRGRFFNFYPPRKVELLKWLGHWMKKGAVPIATLNLQRGVKPGWTIPDAWHHQMVYGVSSKGVYLTNPLEIVSAETVMDQLTSDSVLLVRRQDVVNRFRDWAPLNDFLKQRDTRWQTFNVLGQVVNVLREACTALSHQIPRHRAQLTSHITIPAAYKAGVTLFVRQNTQVEEELFSVQELELRDGSDAETKNLNGLSKCDLESDLDSSSLS
ncbi:uncharacterized protein LOC117337471 [Pecten maximus]|uniref:uncharacterized protein LOC117337471 n=1 Tax=Pecten maximus TaxID=6579 RepID=UPI001457F86B|nr:uncharacterized protein LOC117337471 [Pecten maximus]